MRHSALNGGIRRSIRIFAFAIACATTLFACTDSPDSPVGPGGSPGGAVQFALTPRFHQLGSSSSIAPINLARLTVLDAVTRARIAGPIDIEVNPNDDTFRLPLSFSLPEGVTDANVVVVVELINITAGVESVEWSGVTSPISVTAGSSATPPAPVDVFQGPTSNLSVTDIRITNPPSDALEGDSARLIAVAQGTGAIEIFWNTTDATVATVDSTGLVRMLRNGSVGIIAGAGAHQDTARFDVRARPAAVSITADTMRAVSFGEELVYTAVVTDARGGVITSPITWVSSNEAVLASLGNGRFVARSNGAVTVSATASGVSDLATGIVRQRVVSLTLDAGAFELTAIGDRHTFVPTSLDARGNAVTDVVVRWSSSSAAVATVDAAGAVTAVSLGTAIITGASNDGPTATATVTVRQVVNGVVITPTNVTLNAIGDTVRLTARATDHNGNTIATPSVVWTSSNGAVATIDANGLVRSVSRGTVTITAAAAGSQATTQITVEPITARFVVAPATFTFQSVGASTVFEAHSYDRNGAEIPTAGVLWSSSDPSVASITAAGAVTANARGTTTITATMGTLSATSSVTVQQVSASVVASPSVGTVSSIGATLLFTAEVRDVSGSIVVDPVVTWTSLNTAIATVASDGRATAVSSGTAFIIAASGSKADTVEFRVLQTVLEITPAAINFTSIGATQQLTAQLRDTANNLTPASPTYSTTNAAVASVSASGLVTSTGGGTAKIIGIAGAKADTVFVTVAAGTLNFTVDSVRIAPATNVVVGTSPTVYVYGRNTGTLSFDSSSAMIQLVSASNVVLSPTTIVHSPFVAPGSAVSFTTPVTIPPTMAPQTITVRAIADYLNRIAETNEADNTANSPPVALVAPSPDAVILIPGDTVAIAIENSYELNAQDQNGNPISAVYVSSNPLVAQVDTSGQVFGLSNGYARIVATLNGNADTVFVRVGSAPVKPAMINGETVDRMFIGSADPNSPSWNDANNWSPRGVPLLTDHVLLPDCIEFNFAVCVAAQLQGTTQVASISSGLEPYYYYGDLRTAGIRNNNAKPAASRSISAVMSKLQAQRAKASANPRYARAVARMDSVRASKAGRNPAIGGRPGSRNARLMQSMPSGSNVTIDLNSQQLRISGDVLDYVSLHTLNESGPGNVRFIGDDQHVAYLQVGGHVEIDAREVEVEQVLTASSMTINANKGVFISPHGFDGLDHHIDVDNILTVIGGKLQLYGGDLYVGTNATLSDGAQLSLTQNAFAYIGGAFTSISGSTLKMNTFEDDSEIVIENTAMFDGGSEAGLLTAGEMYSYGDFIVGNAPNKFTPSLQFLNVFDIYDGASHVSMPVSDGSATGNRFNHLSVYDGMLSIDEVNGSRSFHITGNVETYGYGDEGYGTCGAISADVVTVHGNLSAYCNYAGGWQVAEVIMAGDNTSFHYQFYDAYEASYPLNANLTLLRDVYVQGLLLNGNLTVGGPGGGVLDTNDSDYNFSVNGNVIVHEQGYLNLNGCATLSVTGDLTVTGYARFAMGSCSYLDLDGNLTMSGEGDASEWSGGSLRVGGNLTLANAYVVNAAPTHETLFVGNAPHTLSLNGGSLGTFELSGEDVVTFIGDVAVNGTLRAYGDSDQSPTVSSSGPTVTLKANNVSEINYLHLTNVALDIYDRSESENPSAVSNVTFDQFISTTMPQLSVRMRRDTTTFEINAINFFDVDSISPLVYLYGTDVDLLLYGAKVGGNSAAPMAARLVAEEIHSTIWWNPLPPGLRAREE